MEIAAGELRIGHARAFALRSDTRDDDVRLTTLRENEKILIADRFPLGACR